MNHTRQLFMVVLGVLVFSGTVAAGCTPAEFEQRQESWCEQQAQEALWSHGTVSPVGEPYSLPSAEGLAAYTEVMDTCEDDVPHPK